MEIKNTYDIIIIGAGLAGLTCANRLASLGRTVLIVEQHHTIGGYAAYFRRGGHIFDTALHAFPQGMEKSLRKYWGSDAASGVIPLRSVRFENPDFTIDTDFSMRDFKRVLTEQFQANPSSVEAFFTEARSLSHVDGSGYTTGQLIDKHFPNRRDILRLLLETVTYATGTNMEDPAMCYGIVFSNFMKDGTYTYKGGTRRLMSLMKKILTDNGADILLKTSVEKILITNGKAIGVKLSDGRTIAAKAVVSNANLKGTILRLVSEEDRPQDLAEKAKDARLSTSVAQAYFGLKEGAEWPKDAAELYFVSSEKGYEASRYRAWPITCRSWSYYAPGHINEDNPRGAMVASQCSNYADWKCLSPQKYAEQKGQMIAEAEAELEKRHPGISEVIEHRSAATPLTLERYTGHWEGASFGTKFEGYALSDDLPREICGLYHTGSCGIVMSGWLGAVNYGAIVANRVDAEVDLL